MNTSPSLPPRPTAAGTPAPDERLRELAIRAVADACRVTRAVQARVSAIAAIAKDDRSPVTVADFASQAVVGMRLEEACGPTRLVAEESSDLLSRPESKALLDEVVAAVRVALPQADAASVLRAIGSGRENGGAGEFWTLDPVDGTKGFLRSQQYAIALALVRDGVPRIGVLGCPNLPADHARSLDAADPQGTLFVATAGAGTEERSPERPLATGTRVRIAPWSSGQSITMCESVESGHSSHDDAARILAAVGPSGPPKRLDSQCKYAVVARGQAHAYLRMPTRADYVERIWDHAAGALIAIEAGATVCDIDGKPLDFSRGRGLERNRGVVCATPQLAERLVNAIASVLGSR